MDVLDGCPRVILGREIKTRTQIVLTCLIPAVLELLVYIVLIPTDILVVVQLVRDDYLIGAALTAMLIWMPAVLCFLIIIVSPSQWPEPLKYCYSVNICFFMRQVMNLVFFPVGATYRFCRRIFWSIESLMHEKDNPERQHAVNKAAERSPFELYHFLQAFVQSAPQIILQLHILLRKNMFQNYDTTTVQVISIVFSLLQMATMVMTFQRFESQKIVGRCYPWQSESEVLCQQKMLRQRTLTAEEVKARRARKVITPSFPNVMQNFQTQSSQVEEAEAGVEEARKTMNIGPQNFDQPSAKQSEENKNYTDDFKMEVRADVEPVRVSDVVDRKNVKSTFPKRFENMPDDDLIEHADEISEYLRLTEDTLSASTTSGNATPSCNYERTPSLPPPPRPTSVFPYLTTLNRLSTFKDMLIFNTEQIIKDNVPRIPEKVFEHHHHPSSTRNSFIKDDEDPKTSAADEVDFILPTRLHMIEGLEQDDIVGKYISFFGWCLFLLMRMTSLALFSVFYLAPCFYLCVGHYVVMLLCIFSETQFKEKLDRIFFKFFLSYIYIFCLLEFKIKFRHVRLCYIGYFVFVFIQNLTITLVWYNFMEFTSWWFYFMFEVIIGSGVLSLSCLVFYYFYLRPNDKVLFENAEQ